VLLLTQRWGGIFKNGGHGHIGPLKQKSQGAQPPTRFRRLCCALSFVLLSVLCVDVFATSGWRAFVGVCL